MMPYLYFLFAFLFINSHSLGAYLVSDSHFSTSYMFSLWKNPKNRCSAQELLVRVNLIHTSIPCIKDNVLDFYLVNYHSNIISHLKPRDIHLSICMRTWLWIFQLTSPTQDLPLLLYKTY